MKKYEAIKVKKRMAVKQFDIYRNVTWELHECLLKINQNILVFIDKISNLKNLDIQREISP